MQQSNATETTSTTARGTKRKRVALTPHKQEIEQWVEEGRSDEWIGNALGTTPSSVQSFRSRHYISRASKHSPYSRSATEQESSVYEGVLEHGEGESGYGLWLDPAVADDPAFQKAFSGVRDVQVRLEEDRILLTPVPDSAGQEDGADRPGDAGSQLEMVFGAAGVSQAPRSAAAPEAEEGSVKFFDEAKGFGFVHRPTGRELFFHKSEIQGAMTLTAGTEVAYRVASNKRGPVAKDVRALR